MAFLDKRFFIVYAGCLMAMDVEAQVLVITKEVMAQCFFNEPKSAFERCCKDKAEVRDDVIKTITDTISEPIISNLPLYKGKIKINKKINKYEKPVRQINCNAGQYLPANAISCTDCRSRYYLCAGGMFIPGTHDQGMKKCPYGQVADYNTKTCVNDNNNNNLINNKQVIVKPNNNLNDSKPVMENPVNNNNLINNKQVVVKPNNNLNDSKPVMVNPVKTILEEKREAARKACEEACNGHAWCKFDEDKKICNGRIDVRDTADKDEFYKEFISSAWNVQWDTETNKFVCKVDDYLSDAAELKKYSWHWNRDIGACSYTYNNEEYLDTITYKSLWKNVHEGNIIKYPWPHNNIYDHSKDKQYCESLGAGCKYTFIYTGIPKCECKKDNRKMTWVYGQRKCEYCEPKNGKEDCQNDFSSENTHFLEQCIDVLGLQYNKKNMRF